MIFGLDHSPAVLDLKARTSCFVREYVLPVEDASGGDIERPAATSCAIGSRPWPVRPGC